MRYGPVEQLGNKSAVCGVSMYMERKLQSGFGLLILLAPAVGLTQTRPTTPILSICDIRSQPKKFLGRVVTVTGEVQRTFHGISMSSSKCPNVGAALAESNEMRKSSTREVEPFREGTMTTLACTNDDIFKVTVRGRFGTTTTRNLSMYRLVMDKVLRSEFTQQTSQYCIGWEMLNPNPPPVVKIPLQPTPDLCH